MSKASIIRKRYGLNHVPPFRSQSPFMNIFGERVLKELIKFKLGQWGGVQCDMTSVLIRSGNKDTENTNQDTAK
jgi:hypothetical protein